VPNEVPDAIAQYGKARTQCLGNCETGILDMTPLFGYACWCFFGNINSNLGRGPPIDAFDTVCRDLALCYRCIHFDAENEDDTGCDPYNTQFESNLSSFSTANGIGMNNITSLCQTDNIENCTWRTCSCAMSMVTKFFNLTFDVENTYDVNLKHSNGFDYSLECPMQNYAGDRSCCGFYPQRRTFNRHEFRECCNDKSIYNPMRHQCCDDGSFVGLGNHC